MKQWTGPVNGHAPEQNPFEGREKQSPDFILAYGRKQAVEVLINKVLVYT